jgi:hypothetical protein
MTALNLKEETLASIPPPHIAGKQNFVPLAVRNTCPLSAEEIVKLSRIEAYDLRFCSSQTRFFHAELDCQYRASRRR